MRNMADAETVQHVTNWFGLIDHNFSAIAAILGGLIGGLVIFLRELALKKRDFQLRFWDKIVDKRLFALEQLTFIKSVMKQVKVIDSITNANNENKIPFILYTKSSFEEWYETSNHIFASGSTWYSASIRTEVEVLRNYFYNVMRIVGAMEELEPIFADERCKKIGIIIKQDMFNMSNELEELIEFEINTNCITTNIDFSIDNKYVETVFNKTILHQNYSELMAIAKG